MSAVSIVVLAAAALAVNFIKPRRLVGAVVLAVSILSIFWFQPLSAIRNLSFWLPFLSILLTVSVWAVTYPGERSSARPMVSGLLTLLLITSGIAMTRYLGPRPMITPVLPPRFVPVAAAAAATVIIAFVLYYFPARRDWLMWAALGILVLLFLVLKSEPLATMASAALRGLTGQSRALASAGDIAWLGYSFLAFRLLHVLRDRQANRLPACTLTEFAAYALFFPAFIAGPIDRCQNFVSELERIRAETGDHLQARLEKNLIAGTPRILIGAFKKFVLADSLAVFALNAQNAAQTSSTFWMWVMLGAYSLRIYFDFSGYTDVALGSAQLMGIKLPENFDRPYLKLNLTSFWNSWHITLAQWFRSYVFNPITRAARSRYKTIQPWLIILGGQLLTMTLIGLWHGITWNFLIWGIWHGTGLFIQNRWSDWLQPRLKLEAPKPGLQAALALSSWLGTFLYITLGWVWFALPEPQMSLAVFAKLAGLGAP